MIIKNKKKDSLTSYLGRLRVRRDKARNLLKKYLLVKKRTAGIRSDRSFIHPEGVGHDRSSIQKREKNNYFKMLKNNIVANRFVKCRVASCRVVLHRVASCYIASFHVMLYHIAPRER